LTLAPSEGLDEALEQLSETGVSEAVVVDQQQAIGTLTTRDIVAAYKTALARGVRRTKRLGTESELLEARLDAASPLVGKSLQEIVFPADTLVVSIARDGETLFPRGNTLLAEGDRLLFVTDRRGETAVQAFLEQRVPSPSPNATR
jgi:Trk K+ transport system NAD-binding subunit